MAVLSPGRNGPHLSPSLCLLPHLFFAPPPSVIYSCPKPFTAWMMIPAIPCRSLSFGYHSTIRAWLVQIRCALNLDISVERELLDSNTSPGLQCNQISALLHLLVVSLLTGFGSKEKNSSYASFIVAKSSIVVMKMLTLSTFLLLLPDASRTASRFFRACLCDNC